MKDISAEVLSYIISLLRELYFGEVVLIAQNGVLIQVEHTEKVRVHPWQGCPRPKPWTKDTEKNLRQAITQELQGLYYGGLSIVVKQGTVTHFDRLEKQQFMDGDGI